MASVCRCSPLIAAGVPILLLLLAAVPLVTPSGDDAGVSPLAELEKEQLEYYDKLGKKGDNDDKCDVFYDPENGKCAWWNSNEGKYERPALKYDITDNDFKCVNTFHSRIFSPSCGHPKYEMIKHCSKVKFFNNIPPQQGGIGPHNRHLLLLMVDGCLVCLKEERDPKLYIQVNVQLSYRVMAGSFFTSCDERTMETEKFTLTLHKQDVVGGKAMNPSEMSTLDPNTINTNDTNASDVRRAKVGLLDDYYDTGDGNQDDDQQQANYDDGEKKQAVCPDDCVMKELVEESLDDGNRHFGSFAVPLVLLQRKCRGFFSVDTPEDKFYDVVLKVEHNCVNLREKSESPMNIPLAASLKLSSFKENVAEVRGLYINLGANSVSQYQPLLAQGNYRVIKKFHGKYVQNAVEFGHKRKRGTLSPLAGK